MVFLDVELPLNMRVYAHRSRLSPSTHNHQGSSYEQVTVTVRDVVVQFLAASGHL